MKLDLQFMRKLLLTLIGIWAGIATAQVLPINDTVQIAGNAAISSPQFRWGTYSQGGVNYRIPYLGNTGINKIDGWPTLKYLRAFYGALSGGNIWNGIQQVNQLTYYPYGASINFGNQAGGATTALKLAPGVSGNTTVLIRPLNGTMALTSDLTGLTGYIQNQILSPQSSTNFWIDSYGIAKGGFYSGNPFGSAYGALVTSADSSQSAFNLTAAGNSLGLSTKGDSSSVSLTKPLSINGSYLRTNIVPVGNYDVANKYYVDKKANATYTKAHIDSAISNAATQTYYTNLTSGSTVTNSVLQNAIIIGVSRSGSEYYSTASTSPLGNYYYQDATAGSIKFQLPFDSDGEPFLVKYKRVNTNINGVQGIVFTYATMASIPYPISQNSFIVVNANEDEDGLRWIFYAPAGTTDKKQLQAFASSKNDF